jgi:flagellar hook-basal body complex protein FliE
MATIGGMDAAKAYLQTAQTLARQTGPASAQDEGGVSFGSLVQSAAGSVTGAARTAETAITSAALGRADLVDVVTAVAAAEVTLETVIAVRDEVIKAYQEIMRMPV